MKSFLFGYICLSKPYILIFIFKYNYLIFNNCIHLLLASSLFSFIGFLSMTSRCLRSTVASKKTQVTKIVGFGNLIMEEGIANMKLMDEEEEEFNEESAMVEWNYQYCLVGRCLTDSMLIFKR
ncbi:hypothetical protein J1N35_029896 [Gossypium stocksii]|uniref:Transmembrane protein n=1 Tax=Gossypium stocksii TaxID=47602 RepID=A0A9D3V0X2_9ROSI|nr:hypothetical protein J1N35_029896 [Gossypium stocksii]